MRKHSLLKVLTIAFSIGFVIIVFIPLLLPREYSCESEINISSNSNSEILFENIRNREKWGNWFVDSKTVKLSTQPEVDKTRNKVVYTIERNGLNSLITLTYSKSRIQLIEKGQIPYFSRYFSFVKKVKQNNDASLQQLKKLSQ